MSFIKDKGLAPETSDVTVQVPGSLKGRALCLGNDDRVLLAVVRSLGRHGIEVDTGWCPGDLPANRSRYVRRHHELPEYSVDQSDWASALNALVEKEQYDLVIPVNDFAVFPLQLHRDQLSNRVKWYLLDDDVFAIVSDKRRTADQARQVGVPLPVEYRVGRDNWENETRRQQWLQEIRYPVFVKPPTSVVANDVRNKRVVQRIETPQQLGQWMRTSEPDQEWLIQQAFPGVGQGVEVLADRGRVLVEMQHRRIRETIDGGSTCREIVARDRRLSRAARRLIRRLRYTGVAMVEFRIDPQTGQFVLLEINARFWGSLPLAIAAGCDFPWYLYQMLVMGQTRFGRVRPRRIQCRNLLPDLRQIKRQHGVWRSLLSLVSGPMLAVREDHWAWDDWRPYLALWSSMVKGATRRFRDRGAGETDGHRPQPE